MPNGAASEGAGSSNLDLLRLGVLVMCIIEVIFSGCATVPPKRQPGIKVEFFAIRLFSGG